MNKPRKLFKMHIGETFRSIFKYYKYVEDSWIYDNHKKVENELPVVACAFFIDDTYIILNVSARDSTVQR